jgi:hypothetical protein
MAVDFLNCGNAALASAAEVWAKDHGYSVFSLPGSGGTGWGSGK